MTESTIPLETLLNTRELLIKSLHSALTDADKAFLLSFKQGEPKWSLFPHKIELYPSIQWKLQNIQKMSPYKRKASYELLEKTLLYMR